MSEQRFDRSNGNHSLRLSEARELTPAPDPVKAMRNSLQLALFGSVTEGEVIGMAQKLKEMAMTGNLQAMKLFFALVTGGGGMSAPQQPAPVQVAVVNGVGRDDEPPRRVREEPPARRPTEVPPDSPAGFRLDVARLIKLEGPLDSRTLGARMGCPADVVDKRCGDHEWFCEDAGRWNLTGQGFAEINSDREE